MELYQDGYLFTDDYKKMNLNEVCNLLRQSHWVENRPMAVIEKTIDLTKKIVTLLCLIGLNGL